MKEFLLSYLDIISWVYSDLFIILSQLILIWIIFYYCGSEWLRDRALNDNLIGLKQNCLNKKINATLMLPSFTSPISPLPIISKMPSPPFSAKYMRSPSISPIYNLSPISQNYLRSYYLRNSKIDRFPCLMPSPTFWIGAQFANKNMGVLPKLFRTLPSNSISTQISQPDGAARPNSHAKDAAEAAARVKGDRGH